MLSIIQLRSITKQYIFFLSLCLCLSFTHKHARAHAHACTHHHHCHCRQMDWSHLLTESLSESEVKVAVWLLVRLARIWVVWVREGIFGSLWMRSIWKWQKQGAKNDNYTSLISLVRRWYLDGMGTKIKLFLYNNKANLRDSWPAQ